MAPYIGGTHGSYGYGYNYNGNSEALKEEEEYAAYKDYYEEYFKTISSSSNSITPTTTSVIPTTTNEVKVTQEDLERKKRLDAQVRKMMLNEYAIVKDIKEAKEEFNKTSKSSYFLGKKGWLLYQPMMVNGNKIITITKADSCPIIDEDPKESIIKYEIINKIPGNIFKDILASFYLVCKESKDEAAAQIYKRRNNGEYFIYYPQQTVSGSNVNYSSDTNIQTLRIENELVCELHSHNIMGAFWSSTDNANEKEIGFYVVIGGMGKDKLEYRARIKYCDSYFDLKLSDLFDFGEESEDSVLTASNIKRLDKNTAEIMNVITKAVCVTKTYTTYNTEQITNPYYTKYRSKNNTYSKEIQGTLFSDIENTENTEISFCTQYYLKNICKYFCGNKINSNTIYDYLYSLISEKTKIFTDFLNDIIDTTSAGCYDTLINGYNLPECNIDANSLYTKELYLRVSARIAMFSSLSSAVVVPNNPEDFMKFIYTIDNTTAVDASYNLQEFWESLMPIEKYILANNFGVSVFDLGKSMYENETTSYMSIRFLYSIIMSNPEGRKQYSNFISMIDTSFEDSMNSLTGAVADESYYDPDDILSKVLIYLDAAQDKMSFNELFDCIEYANIDVDGKEDKEDKINKNKDEVDVDVDLPPSNYAI